VVPKFLRKKFAGVQQPLGRWILRHIAEFIVLSPAILVTWLWLKLRRKEVLIVGQSSNTISNFLAPLEPELRRRKLKAGSLERVIVLNLSTDANSQIRKMYDRIVTIYGSESPLARRLVWWASQKGMTRKSLFEVQSDPIWVSAAPSVSLTDDEEMEGQKFLAEHGLEKNKYLCYTVRTESYYLARMAEGVILKPQTHRNPSEQTYLEVAKMLSSGGMPILRMGKDLSSKLEKTMHPNVVDYASDFRSDFLDVFLMKYCKYAFVGNTGIVWLRWLFNLPNVHGESYEISRTQLKGDLFLLQKVYLEREDRFATFKEMLLMPGYSEEKHQKRLGVRLVNNTVDEIKAVCDEMNARIDGTWVTTEEDEELQRRYQELIVKYSNKPEWNGGGRIGAQFLRENQDLLRE
jgi:putative glycosyltransferase (TIGR04372 family)